MSVSAATLPIVQQRRDKRLAELATRSKEIERLFEQKTHLIELQRELIELLPVVATYRWQQGLESWPSHLRSIIYYIDGRPVFDRLYHWQLFGLPDETEVAPLWRRILGERYYVGANLWLREDGEIVKSPWYIKRPRLEPVTKVMDPLTFDKGLTHDLLRELRLV